MGSFGQFSLLIEVINLMEYCSLILKDWFYLHENQWSGNVGNYMRIFDLGSTEFSFTLFHIYSSLIHPYRNYGIITWGQKFPILNCWSSWNCKNVPPRFTHFKTNTEHVIPLFVKAKILPVDLLYIMHVSSLIHDVTDKSVSKNVLNLFRSISQVHQYNTKIVI